MFKRLPSKRAVLIGLIVLTWTVILLFSLGSDITSKPSKPYRNTVNKDVDSKIKNTALSVVDQLRTTKNGLVHYKDDKRQISPTENLKPVLIKHNNSSVSQLPESSQRQMSPLQKAKPVFTTQSSDFLSRDLLKHGNSSKAFSKSPTQKSKPVFAIHPSSAPIVKMDNSNKALPISPTPKTKLVSTSQPNAAPLVKHVKSSEGKQPKSTQRQISPFQKSKPIIATQPSGVQLKNLVKDNNISKAQTPKPPQPPVVSPQNLSFSMPPKTINPSSNDKSTTTYSSTRPSQTDNVSNTQKDSKTKSVSSSLNTSLSSNSSKPPRNLHLPNTTMTYDPGVVVYCHESPFIYCQKPSMSFQEKSEDNSTRLYRIGLLRGVDYLERSLNKYGHCEYKNCIYEGANVTKDTDAVVVYAIHLLDSYKPPRAREDQIFVLAAWESPPHMMGLAAHSARCELVTEVEEYPNTRCQASETGDSCTNCGITRQPHLDLEPICMPWVYDFSSVWNYQFNLTMTYRVDSDIFSPYARLSFSPTPLKERPDYYKIAKQKTAPVAWFASNCKTVSRRLHYVREMQKYIDVDIYGSCGMNCVKGPNSPCMQALPVTYKFYLSFENSICTDYISEKLFKLFVPNMHVVPVVRGGANYDKYFPNGTMINSAHFPSAKALALHLKELGSDLKAYSRYLEHKDLYRVTYDGSIESSGCQLCKLLNTRKMEPKIVDAKTWMVDGHC